MATQHNFRIKNGLEVAGTERISSSGVITGSLTGSLASATTATTQSASDNSTKIATTAYTDAAITALVDSSPGALNTLNELAAALGDDANYATTTTNAIAAKAPLASPSFTGTLSVSTVVKLGTWSQDGQTNGFIGFDQSSSDVGLGFGHASGTGRVYYPCRENGSGVSDVISLGTSTYKYKDLHLSGTVSAANLTLDSGALGPHLSFENVGGSTRIKESDSASLYYQAYNHTFEGHTGIDRLHISQIGDISFYEDTGTTAKLFWDASTERLGIGTTSPDYSLHVKGAGHQRIKVEKTDSGGDADISIAGPSDSNGWILFTDSTSGNNSGVIKYVHTGDYMSLRTNGTDDRIRITSDGRIGINNTGAAWVDANDKLITNGRGVFRGYGHSPLALGRYNSGGTAAEAGSMIAFLYGGSGVGSVSITTNSTQYNTTSDIRLKENIQTIVDGSSKIMAMNPVSHTWKDNPTEDAVHGFIAQEMKDIVPESVTGEPEGEEMMQMDYGRITPVIVAGLQDALKEIKELKNRIHELENR